MKVKIEEILKAKCPEKLKGNSASYLGHFNNEKILKEGHNTVAGFLKGFGQGLAEMGKGMITAQNLQTKSEKPLGKLASSPLGDWNIDPNLKNIG